MADPVGVCLALDDATLEPDPAWTRLDDPALSDGNVNIVSGWEIDRGRSDEFERTKTGTARIFFTDKTGVMDPTNSTSDFYPKLEPRKQAAICLKHPVTDTWYPLFRGFVDDFDYQLDVAANVFRGTISLVDGFAILAATEVIPTFFGKDQVDPDYPKDATGAVFYEDGLVDDRIRAYLADAGWPPTLTSIFTGNVMLQAQSYAVRTAILTMLQDAADAEFPGVANIYMDKRGWFTFHGRDARFDPADVAASAGDTAWPWNHLFVGDHGAWVSNSAYAPITSLGFNRGMGHLFNAALATPMNIKEGAIAGQLSTDGTSIGLYGTASTSWENLKTKSNSLGTNTKELETKKVSDYYRDNYKDPRNRVNSIAFRNVRRGHPREGKLWDVMCKAEIADRMSLLTHHPGGGGFNEDFVVEGLRYTAKPNGKGDYHYVEMTADVSPEAYFSGAVPF